MPERTMDHITEHQKLKSFVKVMNGSSVPPNSSLFLPAPFVREHGHEFRTDVTLHSGKNGESFAVTCAVKFPRGRPSVLFCGGWKAFAIANQLRIGDHVTFHLVSMSTFHVVIDHTGRRYASDAPVPLPVRAQLPVSYVHCRQTSGHARAKRAAIRLDRFGKSDALPAAMNLIKEEEHVVAAPEAPRASSFTSGRTGSMAEQGPSKAMEIKFEHE